MTATATPTPQDDVMLRRREKRKHLTSNSIDLRDPYGVLALAIRMDESVADYCCRLGVHNEETESILEVPLETGRIYNQKAFTRALQNLQKQTTTPHYLVAATPSRSKGQPHYSPQAVTPIILSGLVAAIQEQQIENNPNNGSPSAVELVAYCRTMRRAAITRVRTKHRRRKVQRHITPFVLTGVLLALLFWSVSSSRAYMIEFGFVVGNDEDEKNDVCQNEDRPACGLAAARTWMHLNPSNPIFVADCTVQECPNVEPTLEFPYYAMHTLMQPALMSVLEIDNPRKTTSRSYKLRPIPDRRSRSPVQWLGETMVNRLVREAIDEYHPNSYPMRLLDAGCGVGGTLYALLDSNQPPKRKFSYHGIALSNPEIRQAKKLMMWHELNSTNSMAATNTQSITFEKKDFDTPLKQTYSAILAIESLSFSPNITHTMNNLMTSLQSKGVLIIVDDVLAPWTLYHEKPEIKKATMKKSLMTYDDLKALFTSNSLTLKETRDLSIEMESGDFVVQDDTDSNGFASLGNWRYNTAAVVSRHWKNWFGEGETASQKATLRMLQLVQEAFEYSWADTSRRKSFQNADLSYYFMVLVKN